MNIFNVPHRFADLYLRKENGLDYCSEYLNIYSSIDKLSTLFLFFYNKIIKWKLDLMN